MPGGKPKDPDYWKKWRAAHPAYRARERARKRALIKGMTLEERRRDRGPERRVASPPVVIPPLHTGHPLFDEAIRATRFRPGFKYLTHPYYDDLVSAIVLGLLEGRSAEAVRHEFLSKEMAWASHIVQEV